MCATVVLRYYEDLSELQTAQLMGCSESTVNTQAARGLARLRSVLAVPDRVEHAPRGEQP
jgi:DNA-directed RNA polymerase specialized sigma24 family protein